MRVRTVMAAAVAVPTFIMGLSAPALAHDRGRQCAEDFSAVRACGQVSANHDRVYVCDRQADGWGARVWYWMNNGGLDLVGDPGSGRCGVETPPNGARVIRWQVCAGPNGEDRTCSSTFQA